MGPIKVLLVDDHILFRSGLSNLLNSHEGFEVVGEARNGLEALEKAKELIPDIVLMDIYMPEMNGIEATQQLKNILPEVKVVMLTIEEDEQAVSHSMKSGAHRYLSKTVSPPDLFNILTKIYRDDVDIFPPYRLA